MWKLIEAQKSVRDQVGELMNVWILGLWMVTLYCHFMKFIHGNSIISIEKLHFLFLQSTLSVVLEQK